MLLHTPRHQSQVKLLPLIHNGSDNSSDTRPAARSHLHSRWGDDCGRASVWNSCGSGVKARLDLLAVDTNGLCPTGLLVLRSACVRKTTAWSLAYMLLVALPLACKCSSDLAPRPLGRCEQACHVPDAAACGSHCCAVVYQTVLLVRAGKCASTAATAVAA
jgi:hypothetical protein